MTEGSASGGTVQPADDAKAPRYTPIRDYAAIGDCHGAALVSRTGAIDWCCLGRFDAEPIFCRLLDEKRGGFFGIAAPAGHGIARRYLDGTNILRTTFSGNGGRVSVTDFMPVGRRPGNGAHDYVRLVAPGWLIRIVEGERGTVPLTLRYRPSIAFAERETRLRSGPGRVEAEDGPVLYHDLPDMSVDGDIAHTALTVREGARHVLVVAAAPAEAASPVVHAQKLYDITHAFWTEWIAYCRYEGPHASAVRRSALALKLLTYAPSGAIAAAATTSLPERIGGARNWDYRYCWLRDSAFTLYALAGLGYGGEARCFSAFLPRVCAETAPDIQIMYGIDGETALKERTLDHLEGYCGSRPVRVGNDAYKQRQIDVYGEILDWALLFRTLGGKLNAKSRAMLAAIADAAAEHWREPEQGIWEMRAEPRHHVHGKMMAWVALDRAIRLLGPNPGWESERDEIVAEVRVRGIAEPGRHLLQSYDHAGTDAALLLTPTLGFPLSERSQAATLAAVERELRDGDYVYRYRGQDGLPGDEGAFLLCSFWLVDALLHAGRFDDARALFGRLCACANDVGLFSEEIDPETGAFLGNMPQAFTHIGLINAAVNLRLCETRGRDALAGTVADRAKRGIGATLGWRALWSAFMETRRVGRLLSSRRSVMDRKIWGTGTRPAQSR